MDKGFTIEQPSLNDKAQTDERQGRARIQRLDQLPPEIFLLHIFPYLSNDELCYVRLVNRTFGHYAVQNLKFPRQFYLTNPDLWRIRKFPEVCSVYREVELFPRKIFPCKNAEYNFDSNSTKQDLQMIELLRNSMPSLERVTVDFKSTHDGGAISTGVLEKVLDIFSSADGSQTSPLTEIHLRNVPLWFFSKTYTEKSFNSLKASLSAYKTFTIDIVTCEHDYPDDYEDDQYLLEDWVAGVNTGCFCDGNEMTRLQMMGLRLFFAALSANENLRELGFSWIKGGSEDFNKGNRNIFCRCVPDPFLPLFKRPDFDSEDTPNGKYRVPPHKFVALDYTTTTRNRFPKKSFPKYGSFGSVLVPQNAKELFTNVTFPQVERLKLMDFFILDTNAFNSIFVSTFANIKDLEMRNVCMWGEHDARGMWMSFALAYRQLMMVVSNNENWELRGFKAEKLRERSKAHYAVNGWREDDSGRYQNGFYVRDTSLEDEKVNGPIRAMLFGPLE